ncbi:MAG: AAA family ATPase [Melioribacteraceae bacterium]|jgi:DNA polymerase-3 subunit delta'|nr:AAA family ATPase [Melioribacteraceae bacterium]
MHKLWNEIDGQVTVKKSLQKIIDSRRVPHAFLFFGQEGVGKFFCALQLAKILNSQSNIEDCEKIVKKISLLQEPYIKMIFPLPRGKNELPEDGSLAKLSKSCVEEVQTQLIKKSENPYHKIFIEDANTIKINSIREIKKFLTTSAFEDNIYRLIIILDAHLMNEQSQNALLKSIEEPPEKVIFILITSDKEKLLPTIRSRSTLVEFAALGDSDLISILKKYYNIDESVSSPVIKFFEGSVINAVNMINMDLTVVMELTIELLRYSLAKKYDQAIKVFNKFMSEFGQDSVHMLLKMIKFWMGDTIKNKRNGSEIYFEKYVDTIQKFNQRFPETDPLLILAKIEKLENTLNHNVNLNVFCLNLIFTLASISIRK